MKKPYKNVFEQNRRSFLKTVLAAGVSNGLLRASPLVGGMMLSRAAEAQTAPNKSVTMYVPGGAIYQYWEPSANFTLPAMSAAYEPVKNDILFLRNMRHRTGGHGSLPVLMANGWSGRDSFEVNMGRVLGADTPFPYLNLGVMSNGFGTITKDAGSKLQFQDNPFAAFNRLFGNGGTGPTDPNSGLKLNVVDAHKEAVNALTTKLGAHEKQRLDKHLTAIEETEQRLINSGGGGSCATGPAPTVYPLNSTTFTQQAHLQADIIALAFGCNLTRSASLGFGNHQGTFSVPELNYKGIYHQSIHGGQGGSTYLHYQEMRNHLSGLSAYMIQKLKSEGLLDTTIVTELSDMGHGDSHGGSNIPNLIAGGGSTINTGNVRAGSGSYDNYDVLHTAAAALGATQSPLYEGFQGGQVIPGVLA